MLPSKPCLTVPRLFRGALLTALFLATSIPAQVLLWPEGAPGAKGTADVDKPTLTPYPAPSGKANGAAMVICPGGGYFSLSMVKEGSNVALWLNSLGVHAFVLKYRLGPTYHHPVELNDAKRAMRWVRANAARYGIDTARVGILGFSAGGHLAATVATLPDGGNPAATDTVDRHPSRPFLQVLLYSVITMDLAFTNTTCRTNLLGSNPSQAVVDSLSSEKQVNASTPPAFLAHTRDDGTVQFKNSQVYADSLKKAGVPVELRSYPNGPHGFGLADGKDGATNRPDIATWTGYAATWMEARGFFRKSTALPGNREKAPTSRPGVATDRVDALGRQPSSVLSSTIEPAPRGPLFPR